MLKWLKNFFKKEKHKGAFDVFSSKEEIDKEFDDLLEYNRKKLKEKSNKTRYTTVISKDVNSVYYPPDLTNDLESHQSDMNNINSNQTESNSFEGFGGGSFSGAGASDSWSDSGTSDSGSCDSGGDSGGGD